MCCSASCLAAHLSPFLPLCTAHVHVRVTRSAGQSTHKQPRQPLTHSHVSLLVVHTPQLSTRTKQPPASLPPPSTGQQSSQLNPALLTWHIHMHWQRQAVTPPSWRLRHDASRQILTANTLTESSSSRQQQHSCVLTITAHIQTTRH